MSAETDKDKVDKAVKGKPPKPKKDKKDVNGPQYFYEDEVCRTAKSGEVEFGMVMENWEMYASDDEDDSDASRVPRGYVSVNWHPKGKEETVREAKVHLSDRSLMPGDVVRRQQGTDTQRGYCRSVKVYAAAQIVGTKKIIPNILASNVRQLQNLQPDVAVYLDSWVGVIHDVHSTITLRLPDKSQCTIDSQRLVDVFEDTRRSDLGFNSSEVFYPGQRLRGPLKRLKDAKFINSSEEYIRPKDNKNVIVTVLKIEPAAVRVEWQWQAPSCLHSFKTTTTTVITPTRTTPEPDPNYIFGTEANGSDSDGQKLKYQRFIQRIGGGNIAYMDSALKSILQTVSNCMKLDHPKKDQGQGSSSDTNLDAHADIAKDDGPIQSTSSSPDKNETSAAATEKVEQNPASEAAATAKTEVEVVSSTNEAAELVSKDKDDERPDLEMFQSKMYDFDGIDDVVRIKSPRNSQPPDFITGEALKSLKCLNLFDACTVQLGDFSLYAPTLADKEGILERNVWRKVAAAGHDVLELVPITKSLTLLEADTSSAGLEDTHTTTEEDGDTSDDEAEAVGLKGKKRTNKHKGPRVVTKELRKKKLRKSKPHPLIDLSPGTEIVIETVHTSSFVDVVWQDGTIQEGIRSVDLYPIHHLDDHEFFPGDFVVRAGTNDSNKMIYGVVQNTDHHGRVALVQWFEPNGDVDLTTSLPRPQPKQLELEEMSVYDLRDHAEYKFRPGTIVIRIGNILPEEAAAGQVVDNYPDGQVRVWWATTGTTSACWPQEIYRLADYDSDEGELWHDNGSDSSWETQTDEEEIEKLNEEDNNQTNTLIPNTADAEADDTADEKALTDSSKQETPVTPTANACVAKTFSDPYFKIPCAERFTLVDINPGFHHYGSSSFEPHNAKSFLKVVQKEIKLFRENLPAGIFVKGYEDRMDLYSVMICGPENTPYEDGLFLFDVQLPPNYPHAPPFVHYSSFCDDRLNPNLYECGKVCVSLLGTWSGKGSEVWSSTDSNLLQLLVSIQGLILVSEPYYNEAGYEKQKGSDQGMENSRMYNEMVIIKLVQSMSRQLAHPLPPWEKEIKHHILEHGPRLIKRLRLWLKQSEQERAKTSTNATAATAPVKNPPTHGIEHDGERDENAQVPGFSLLPVSKGFAISLKKSLDNFAKLCDQPDPASRILNVEDLD